MDFAVSLLERTQTKGDLTSVLFGLVTEYAWAKSYVTKVIEAGDLEGRGERGAKAWAGLGGDGAPKFTVAALDSVRI